ncbi:MAG: cysteine--tRNA ligase [Bacteroidota bacterium]
MASHPPFQLFNTLSNSIETLEPRTPGKLRMYSCGPTVYSYAHIGNFRTFLTGDLILRVAKGIGWDALYVSNITDVGHLTEDDVADATGEDKMANALKSKEGEQFINVWDLARYYTEALLEDWQSLNMHEPDVRPRATEHITQQIEAIEQLIAKGHAYETENAVYFDVSSFKDYGKLSGNKSEDNLVEAVRDIVVDAEKRNPRDFALWKKDEKHLMQWYSPFGRGFPGWHIECSVMSMQYLGEHFDLHGGGEDLIFPHHECEIAQAEGLTGSTFADMWVHTRFLQVEGEKMSKSKGNFFTVRQLTAPAEEGGKNIDPFALRLALISGHYRKPFNFTFKNLKDCARIVDRFRGADEKVTEALAAGEAGDDHLSARLDAIYDRVLHALLDDLNTPLAIAAALEGAKLIHGFKTLSADAAAGSRKWLDGVNALLGIYSYDNGAQLFDTAEADPIAEKVEQLIVERKAARNARDFARADEIRDELDAMGVELKDTPEGTKWSRKLSI